MSDNREFIDYVEFYITHTCNFNCEGCNRFNNYAFTGHQRWSDYKDIYEKWSKRLKFNDYYILGGEPMSNPDLLEWISGIRHLWGETNNATLVTNGSYEKKFNQELYKTLLENKTNVSIGLHNVDRRDHILETVLSFLHHPVKIFQTPAYDFLPKLTHTNDICSGLPELNKMFHHELEFLVKTFYFWKSINDRYQQIKPSKEWVSKITSMNEWNNLEERFKKEATERYDFNVDEEKHHQTEYLIIDKNHVKVKICLEDFFHQGALKIKPETNSFTLHDSDPVKAHEICHTKHSHHFINGKLNKCGTSVIFSEFDKQFNLDLSEKDRELIYTAPVGHIDMTDEQLSEFVGNLKNHIPQCKFCPQNYEYKKIYSSSKKSTFGRKRKLNTTIKEHKYEYTRPF